MDEIQFYKVLSSDLSSLLNQTKNAVSSEEFVYVNQKEYIKIDRDKSTFKSHRDFDSEIEMTFKHF